MTSGSAGDDELRKLGARLRAFRIASGLSQRALIKRIGLSAHSNLTDYELGRRLPPTDVLVACEQALGVPAGELRELRDAVLAARADHAVPTPPASRRRMHRVVIAVAGAATTVGAAAVLLLTVVANHANDQGSPPLVLAAGSGTVHVSSCDDGAVILERDVVDGPLPASRGRRAIGELALRYSASCGLAWARFQPGDAAAGNSGTLVLSVHRRDDGATSAVSLARVGAVESDPLLTVPGCVYAQVTIAFASGPPVTARTGCRQG